MGSESAPPSEREITPEAIWRKLTRLESRINEVESVVGREASETKKLPATGLHLLFTEFRTELRSDLNQVSTNVALLTKAVESYDAARKAEETQRNEDALALAKKREPWSRATWIVIGSALGFLTTTGLGALLWTLAKHVK